MADLILATPGELCLIQQDPDGRICQIAMTTEQHKMMQLLLGTLSKAQSFIKIGPEHDLVLKATVDAERKSVEEELMIFGNWLLSGKVNLTEEVPGLHFPLTLRRPMIDLLEEFKNHRKK